MVEEWLRQQHSCGCSSGKGSRLILGVVVVEALKLMQGRAMSTCKKGESKK